MKHLKLFENNSDYQAFIDQMIFPNVSYIKDTMEIYYNSSVSEEWYSNYLTIEALEDGLSAAFFIPENAGNLEYCIDNGDWITLESLVNTQPINKGQMMAFRGNLTSITDYDNNLFGIGRFGNINKNFNLKGNCMSLLFGDNAKGHTSLEGYDFVFSALFLNCTTLKDVDKNFLPATTLSADCYFGMFAGCTSLTTAPELPATTLANECYYSMFAGCTSLTEAPELPATTLTYSCYSYMFLGCTSLTTAPELLATTLEPYCYQLMFDNCSNLNYIKMLATDISAECCLLNWVSGVASTGTFVKATDDIYIDTSGVPYDWEYNGSVLKHPEPV